MAERVGSIHIHDLPAEMHVNVGEVYRCHCNKEFYVGKDKTDGTKGWYDVTDLVVYDKTVKGETFIGNWTPDIEFDEEPVDQLAGEDTDEPATTGE